MKALVTFIIGGICLIVGMVLCVAFLLENENITIVMLIVSFLTGGFLLYLSSHRRIILQPYLKEVDLHEVTVVGENKFEAQIEIIYRDGKFKSVELIPETTKKV